MSFDQHRMPDTDPQSLGRRRTPIMADAGGSNAWQCGGGGSATMSQEGKHPPCPLKPSLLLFLIQKRLFH